MIFNLEQFHQNGPSLMTSEQALSILAQATEPGARLSRKDYVAVEQALATLNNLVQENTPQAPPTPEEPPTPKDKAPKA